MLVTDFRKIGGKLYQLRKSRGLTQFEVAELAELSDRTYADIERGTVNMRIETLLKICNALHITPDEILTENPKVLPLPNQEILSRLDTLSPKERNIALQLLLVYLEGTE